MSEQYWGCLDNMSKVNFSPAETLLLTMLCCLVHGGCDIILTLTFLSHPDETMIGLAVFGENLTHDTQSLWASSYNQTQKQHLCQSSKFPKS